MKKHIAAHCGNYFFNAFSVRYAVPKLAVIFILVVLSICKYDFAMAGQPSDSLSVAGRYADYRDRDWPRAHSALKIWRHLIDPHSGYRAGRLHSPGKPQNSMKCRSIMQSLLEGKFEEIQPVLVTDDPDDPGLAKYRVKCPEKTFMIDTADIQIVDYLTEFIGQYNYRKYRIPLGGDYGKELRDFICADVDPEVAMHPRAGPGCFFPNEKTCKATKYKYRPDGAGAIGAAAGVYYTQASNRMVDVAFPYGFSVVSIDGSHFILEADKSPVRDGQYYSFQVVKLNRVSSLTCLWSYFKGE